MSDDQFRIKAAESRKDFSTAHAYRLLMVHEHDFEKSEPFNRALKALKSTGGRDSLNLKNIYIGGPEKAGKLAFVFPGQGSQYLGMGRDFVCTFPQALKILEDFNEKLRGRALLSDLIFPPPACSTEERQRQEKALKSTDIAQPAIGAVSLAMLKILQKFAINPDATCGHSFGEMTALCAAGWIDEQALMTLSVTRGRLMAAAAENPDTSEGAMLAVQAPLNELEALIENSSQKIVIANRNSPNQGVLSGTVSDIIDIEKICRKKKLNTVRLPVSTAFHSELVKDAAQPFADALKKVPINTTAVKVFSNTKGKEKPADADEARTQLGKHLISQVNLVKEIQNMIN